LIHDSYIAITLLAAAATAAGFFAYVYTLKRQTYLLLWTAGWSFFALHYLSPALAPWLPSGPAQIAMNRWLYALAGLSFVLGAQFYSQRKPWKSAAGIAAVVLGVWAAANALGWMTIVPVVIPSICLYLAVGVIFWIESRRQETLADRLLAISFFAWAALRLTIFLVVNGSGASSADGTGMRALAAVPSAFVAMLMVMATYEEEKRRIERNMLALSNLNLATSSFVGGEIQRMLSQALDRVLGVVRLPAGALFLHHGDPQGPTSVVAAGLNDDFCRVAQEEGLDDYLVGLVSRMGGLLGFRDLRDASLAALEKDESIRRFRQLGLAQGLRSVVVISLQAKEQAFGVLLLGTPDNRRFTPAELRLLLALGHQIGMAVENSYLVQQTSRRSEELHVLNEIGRALSSTLNKEDLLNKIWEELRRLFAVENFYIVELDPLNDEILFDLEMIDGMRMPKRTRPAGNHLNEYVIRTRQPVLIRENFLEEAKKFGVVPIRTKGCICVVPLVAYDHAIGAMGVFSDNDHAFDEGHLELMRVLASEASIAIENARLFNEERTKARHLSLLNTVSRNAIATLNPDEMLAKITEQLEEGLTHDHVGIGVLDYSTRELEIRAEGGARRGVVGNRVPLGVGLVGQVARTGHMAAFTTSAATNDPGLKPMLPDSTAAIALPIFYAEALHGVLYVESSKLTDFSEEEVLLLRTLADLIAGAYHNAMSFQKAQEQAITDGLTGVKTHRFFMESLSAEWKRSTRAGRAFALVLMDLDRFKFVNDFYGHLEGDLVLQRVGHILEANCRRSDVVARYGGDEFVMLMPETNMEHARQLATKLRGWVSADPLLREKNISASFGIACYPLHGSTPQELIQVADASMYLSKHQGGNAVSTADHFDPNEAKKWKRDVLEAYLGVTLKRLFSTGPEAFEEIYSRLKQFTESLATTEITPAPGEVQPASSTLPQAVLDTVTSLAFAIDAKDHYTQGHSQKVSAYAALIAEAMGMNEAEVEEIRLGGVLHDIGKVAIPENILNKNGPLNPDEWDTMKSHVTFGAKILDPLAPLARVREMVLHHHEYFDGSGYPDGLASEQIPLGARIIAVADAFDTITSDRTYKKARAAEDALNELVRCANAQFDGRIVELFVRTMRQLPNPVIEVASLVRNS
jgi:diguanylate cyclase (GGDEF)-like protein/putative nucleotidyltransferase with HDIG domain